jgi:RHS repeat-associated protein
VGQVLTSKLRERTDNRGQETRYSYDQFGRVTEVQHWNYHWLTGLLTEDPGQRVNYSYDTDLLSGNQEYARGRLTEVTFGGGLGGNFYYRYSYNGAGRVAQERFGDPSRLFDTSYSWDNEGRMTQMVYPGGETHGFTFDAMGRVSEMGGVGDIEYGAAGQITRMSYFGMVENRTYNSLLQMTRQTVEQETAKVLDMEYVFTAGANDGRIVSSIDRVANETVNYAYNSLQQLELAETAGAGGWGQRFTYDGFGNLTRKEKTKGPSDVPTLSATYDSSNHLVGGVYDGNGNQDLFMTVYDVENRMVGWQGAEFRYDHRGKRVLKRINETLEYTVYGFGGQKLVTQTCALDGTGCTSGNHVYFGGKLVKSRGVVLATDRLGSVRANGNGERFQYYPYGEERGVVSSGFDGREKWGTYTRDTAYYDYADQREYAVGSGKFMTPDPYMASGGVGDPGSWNRYAYVQGDPVNRFDPSGLLQADPNDTGISGYYFSWGLFTGYGPEGPYTYIGQTLVPTGQPNGQTGTGGGSNPHGQAFWTAANTLWKALDVALAKLDSEKCRSLFGNGSSSPDPRGVLKGLLYGTSKYGNVTVDDIRDDPGKVTSATTTVTGLRPIDIGNDATQLVNGTVLIKINYLAGDFANGDVREAAATLLHELGHAYHDLTAFLGGSLITPDGGDVTKSQANQALIKKNCF